MAWSEEARRKASQSRKNNSKAKATQGSVKQSEYSKTVNRGVRAMKKKRFFNFSNIATCNTIYWLLCRRICTLQSTNTKRLF